MFFYNQFYIGGSLLFHIRKLKYLSEDLSKKICQSVATALDLLHKQKKLVLSMACVLTLELKPEHVLLDENGMPHISMLNSVKFSTASDPEQQIFKGSIEYFCRNRLMKPPSLSRTSL